MTLWRRWLRRGASSSERARDAWRRTWRSAVEQSEPDLDGLRRALAGLGLPEEEVELEQEMLDGLTALADLRRTLSSALPVVETRHRVIGSERCHFTTPVSMPDHPSQPAGRLLFTATRWVFVAGGTPTTVAWHAVSEVRQAERDLVLARVGGDGVFRFRANGYADALCGAELARHFVARQRRAL